MGNALCYSCSPSHEPNEISTDIIPALEQMQSMDKVEELMDYIDRILSNIGTGAQGQVGRPNSVASSIISGGNLIETLSKRLKRHVCKKCLLSALDRQTRNAVIDVLKEAEPIPCLGMALSIAAHLLERAEQVSSNKEECLRLLRYMLTLAKHIKNLDTHLERPKLDEILCFIVKGTLMCALLMQPSRFCRFMFAPLDAADLENLKSDLLFVYPDLALEAATELFNIVAERLPIVPGPSQGEYPQDAVGLEDAQNAVTELLNLTESSIRVVVIYGVGGIGKTTLATAVFNSLDLTGYHYCRVEMDQDCRNIDLQAIQKQILSDVFGINMEVNNCTKGREKLSKAFGNASRPVFLFIDNALKQTDLDNLLPIQHLSRLPMQSRILLTTRNLSETKNFELHDGINTYSYIVNTLTEPGAKELLCHYALGDKNGSFDQGVDMDGLLQICGRIPLVLRIVGSHLRADGKTVSACNEILESYKEWQQRGVEGGGEDLSERMVDSVYRRLKEPCKEAFLDISFFFYDWERSKVEDIVGEVHLKDLERAALITTSQEDRRVEYDYHKVKMTVVKVHDIVRARARKLSEGNRITNRDSLSTLLRDEQKLRQTKGVCLPDDYDDWKEFSVQAKHVDLMSRSLRVLSLGNNTRVNGLCESAFEDLRFLRIFYEDMLPIQLTNSKQLVCFDGHLMRGRESHLMRELKFPELPMSSRLLEFHAPQDFPPVSLDFKGHLTALREIKLSNINLTNFENGIRQLKSLRHLLLEKCEGFTSIPESLENFSCLKILSLNNCSMLERLPGSFGNLSSLQYLHIRFCSMFERFPESIGHLSSLQRLDISRCSKLERFPESIGNLSSLQTLNTSGCSKLERFRESIGNLSSLQRLNTSGCSKLERFPESIGNLSSLQTLNTSGCSKLERFPESIGNLSSLQTLNTSGCSKLERFPESIGNLSSLQTLNTFGCSKLETFPESIGNLSSLQTLDTSGCSKLERFPESIGNLWSLQTLNTSGCSKLERFPESIGNLWSLQTLNTSGCSKLERFPESIGNLSSLQTLDTSGCSKLEKFPESIGNLSSLQTLDTSGCSMLDRLPESFGNHSSLRILIMHNCSNLERLPQTFDQLSCLQTLEVDGGEKMCSLFDSFGQLRCLKFLSIRDCRELKRLAEDIVCLPSLAGVRAYGCAELEANAMDSLVMIKSLMFLEMGESPKLIKRWEEIQQHNPTIGAALRFEYRKYPYEDIMSRMFFCGERRFVGVDSDGQLVEVASSSFPDVGEKVGVLLTACDISNAVRERVMEVASSGFQIICVDVGVEWEAEGSSWMEERDHRIKKTLLQLPQRSRAWTSLSHKTTLLFAYSLWHFVYYETERSPDTLIVGTSVLVDEEGRRRLSSLEMKYPTDRSEYSGGVELWTLFSPLWKVSKWMMR